LKKTKLARKKTMIMDLTRKGDAGKGRVVQRFRKKDKKDGKGLGGL